MNKEIVYMVNQINYDIISSLMLIMLSLDEVRLLINI